MAKLAKFPLELPADLDAFFEAIIEKEERLRAIEQQLRELQNNQP